MYIQKIHKKQKNKIYTSTVLAESYRKDGKMKRRIIANLTKVPEDVVSEITKFLKTGKNDSLKQIPHSQGKSCGALIVIKEVAKRLGIIEQLGNDTQGKLALLQIAARIITQRSRLFAANDWQLDQAIAEIINIDEFNEDNLYYNLDWLSKKQQEIEDNLFKIKSCNEPITTVYLYDVTSSYLEGEYNELADYGYNRDGKKGKKQIVIGLLCDHQGDPISVEVFKGNKADTQTVASQISKLKDRFGIKKVVLVGDKGMIKSTQISDLSKESYNFITTITKPQIEKLIKNDIIQYSFFDKELVEVENEGVRYILRKNPVRSEEIKQHREEILSKLKTKIELENEYLDNHLKAKQESALKRINSLIDKYKFSKILEVGIGKNKLVYVINEEGLEEKSKFDGCYVIKTDLAKEEASKDIIHQRYKDLANVELAFRTLKSGLEEIRPIFVRKESRTRGHVFICMLAYKIVKYIWDNLKDKTPLTQKGIFKTLDKIQFIEYSLPNYKIKKLPSSLQSHQTQIFEELKIKLPTTL